jgi:glycosyltransferase involved in cell wall biosynthesis
MKVVQVGPEGIHLSNYCASILPIIGNFGYIGETNYNIVGANSAVVAPFRGLNIFIWIQSYFKIKKYLKSDRPDVIHIHQVNRLAFFVCLAAQKFNIPIVTTAWGSDVLLVPKKSFLHRFIAKFVLKNSAAVTGDSQQMISAIRSLVPKQKNLQCLQYGITPVKHAIKENLIYSNRLHKPLYRIDLIIKLFAEFYSKHNDWKLVIGAEGEQSEALKKLAISLLPESAIEFTGWLNAEQNASWYSRASIYISLPESDGTSVSLLEAMSANCIPIVPNLPVSEEWVKSGVNGIIYKNNTNPIEDALRLDYNACCEINQALLAERALKSTTSKLFYSIYEFALK